ncbi:MAG: hypothetical protein RR853_09085, partial [Aurantimicrobium sp.]|uniref:hypothetical protein n=1 Tax=Aurantimicrobium sp. TaxID=1930784 RepID=UPI002FCB7452
PLGGPIVISRDIVHRCLERSFIFMDVLRIMPVGLWAIFSLEYGAFVSNPLQPPVGARIVFNRKGESSLFD